TRHGQSRLPPAIHRRMGSLRPRRHRIQQPFLRVFRLERLAAVRNGARRTAERTGHGLRHRGNSIGRRQGPLSQACQVQRRRRHRLRGQRIPALEFRRGASHLDRRRAGGRRQRNAGMGRARPQGSGEIEGHTDPGRGGRAVSGRSLEALVQQFPIAGLAERVPLGACPGVEDVPLMSESLSLGFDLRFEDLYGRDGLVRLDGCFVDFVKRRNADLHNRLMAARAAPEQLAGKAESDSIVELAPELEDFIVELFGIAREVDALRSRHDALAPLYTVKRLFVQRRAAKKYGPDQATTFDGQALREQLEALLGGELTELRFAQRVDTWMKVEAEHAAALDLAARYAAWATHTPQGRHRHKGGVLFKVPHKIDPHHLIPVETEVVDGVAMLKLPPAHRRARDGFALTDPGTDLTGALDHANYCIWCHNQ